MQRAARIAVDRDGEAAIRQHQPAAALPLSTAAGDQDPGLEHDLGDRLCGQRLRDDLRCLCVAGRKRTPVPPRWHRTRQTRGRPSHASAAAAPSRGRRPHHCSLDRAASNRLPSATSRQSELETASVRWQRRPARRRTRSSWRLRFPARSTGPALRETPPQSESDRPEIWRVHDRRLRRTNPANRCDEREQRRAGIEICCSSISTEVSAVNGRLPVSRR